MVCIVLGGGISGLSASYYLRKFGYKSKIILIEASSRLGGWINSYTSPQGTLYELGPRTLRTAGDEGKNSLQLAQELHLSNKVISIPQNHPAATNRLIKVGGKLHHLPNSFKSILKKTPPFSKPLAWHFIKEPFVTKVTNDDESFYSFIERRVGHEVAAYLVDPISRGIFAGNARDLSVRALAELLHRYEQDYGSFIKGFFFNLFNFQSNNAEFLQNSLVKKALMEKWSVWSLKGGLITLVDALSSYLLENDVTVLKGTEVTQLCSQNGRILVKTIKDTYEASDVISCLPAYRLGPLISDISQQLREILSLIPFVTTGVINLEYEGNLIDGPAFGYLIPSTEPSKVLGVIYDSFVFPQGEKTILTVMVGGYWFKEIFGDNPSNDDLLSAAMEEVNSTLNIRREPISHKVSVLRNCIPQYTVGHFERVQKSKMILKENAVPLFLAGNSFDGVSVNHSIYNAKQQALAVTNSL